MLARIDRDCLAHHPDLTIVMTGSNDCHNKLTPLPEYEQDMRTLISKILDAKSRILLMNILPVYEPDLYTRHDKAKYGALTPNEKIREINAILRKLADEYSLAFLDMHHIFVATGNIGTDKSSLLRNEANSNYRDGVHPTEDGYRLMATAIYECIVSKQLSCTRIVCFGDSITASSYPDYLKRLLKHE
jgi:lysophospholipase L1-like esterase